MSNNDLREWSARLEAGEQDEELLALAARLERAGRNEPSTIPLDYRRQLRRDLLARYPAAQATGRRWRLVQTLAALGGLALVVILTWFTMSSLQRPAFGVAPSATDPAVSNYIYLGHVLTGGVLLENVTTADGETQPQAFLMPGVDLTLNVNWSLPPDAPPLSAFAHLLDETGAVVAQSDTLFSAGDYATPQQLTLSYQLPIPEALPPGRYQLVIGLYDSVNGGRVPFVGPEGETTQLALGEYELPSNDSAALDGREVTPAGATTTPLSDPGYRFLGYSTNGGIVTETVETDDPANQTVTHLLVPGMTMTVTLNWSLPPEAAIVSAFVHLLDDDGQTVAQADAPVKAATGQVDQPFAAVLALNLPADLPAGEYDLVAGLYDPVTGAQLPISIDQDQSMTVLLWGDYQVAGSASLEQMREFSIIDAQHDVLHFRVLEAEEDALAVHEVSPPAGSAIGGAAPTEFVITVDYALKSLPQAILEVRVVEDLGNESGRGVGLATAELTRGAGTTSVVVRVNPSTELAGAADLGVLLQLKPDAASAPIVTVMPDNVGWPYQP